MGDVLDPRRAFHPRTSLWASRGPLRQVEKTIPPRRVYRFLGTTFPLFVRIFFKRSQSNHTIIGMFSLK
jgi:hypothetical protein